MSNPHKPDGHHHRRTGSSFHPTDRHTHSVQGFNVPFNRNSTRDSCDHSGDTTGSHKFYAPNYHHRPSQDTNFNPQYPGNGRHRSKSTAAYNNPANFNHQNNDHRHFPRQYDDGTTEDIDASLLAGGHRKLDNQQFPQGGHSHNNAFRGEVEEPEMTRRKKLAADLGKMKKELDLRHREYALKEKLVEDFKEIREANRAAAAGAVVNEEDEDVDMLDVY